MEEKAQNSAKNNLMDVALALFEMTVLLDPKQAEREKATYKWLPLALAFTPEIADTLVRDSVNHFLEFTDSKIDRDAVAGNPTALQFGKQLKAETRKRLAAGAQQMAQALINVSIDLSMSADIDPMAALASALGRPARQSAPEYVQRNSTLIARGVSPESEFRQSSSQSADPLPTKYVQMNSKIIAEQRGITPAVDGDPSAYTMSAVAADVPKCGNDNCSLCYPSGNR